MGRKILGSIMCLVGAYIVLFDFVMLLGEYHLLGDAPTIAWFLVFFIPGPILIYAGYRVFKSAKKIST